MFVAEHDSSEKLKNYTMPIDLRTQKLAKLVVDYCVFVKPNENVIISGSIEASDFILALYKEVILRGAHPILRVNILETNAFFFKHAKEHQIKKFPDHFDYMVKHAHKYIEINTSANTRELANCSPKKIAERKKVIHPITDYIVNAKPNIYRVTCAYPCMSLAQEAEMSLNEYEKFVYDACLQDWKKLRKKLARIKSIFKEGSKIHLIGEGVDLKFKVHGKKAMSDLELIENMPGGEIFMAPIRESLNGKIKFDFPAIKDGKEVTDIELTFKDGKVIEAHASKNEDFLKKMLSIDENASYVGEFGIGYNPKINKFTKNLLFDEKMSGTIHLALGMAYKENGGGNDSAIHWDIVKDMKRAKIIVDGKVIQENGIWKI